MVAFQYADDAVAWCLETQGALLFANWPPDILEHPSCAVVAMPITITTEGGNSTNVVSDLPYLFRGLRVRMGIHTGLPQAEYNPRTNSVDYFGPMVFTQHHITNTTAMIM